MRIFPAESDPLSARTHRLCLLEYLIWPAERSARSGVA